MRAPLLTFALREERATLPWSQFGFLPVGVGALDDPKSHVTVMSQTAVCDICTVWMDGSSRAPTPTDEIATVETDFIDFLFCN